MFLVFCRSGRRSQIAIEVIVGLGNSIIYEFGGIIDWPYGMEK